MKKILLFFMLITSASMYTQNDEAYVDAQVTEFTASLEQRGIDTYFTVKRFCNGEVEMFKLKDGKMCISKGTYFDVYVVWRENDGSSMIKKIDNCGLFFSLPLVDKELFDWFAKNVETLMAESVAPYEVANPENVPALSAELHPCSRAYTFKSGSEQFRKSFDLFDLTNESKQENLNYESNQNLLIVALDQKLDVALDTMASDFKRQF